MKADCLLFSGDTVINGSGVAPGAKELFSALSQGNIRFAIVCEETVKTRAALAEQLNAAGVDAVNEDCFYTTAMAAIDLIVSGAPEKRTAGYIGGKGLREILEQGGFSTDSVRPDWLFIGNDRNAALSDYSYALNQVAAGAQMILLSETAAEINHDVYRIGPSSVCAMLENASGKKAVRMGLPSPLVLMRAAAYLGVKKGTSIFVTGDYPNGIAAAEKAGMSSVLLLNEENVKINYLEQTLKPTFMIERLDGLIR